MKVAEASGRRRLDEGWSWNVRRVVKSGVFTRYRVQGFVE